MSNNSELAEIIKTILEIENDEHELEKLRDRFYKLEGAANYMLSYLKDNLPSISDDYLFKYMIYIFSIHDKSSLMLKISSELVKSILEKYILSNDLFDYKILNIFKYGWENSIMTNNEQILNIIKMIEKHFDFEYKN